MFTRLITKIPMLNLRKLYNKKSLIKIQEEKKSENCLIKFIKDFFITKKNN